MISGFGRLRMVLLLTGSVFILGAECQELDQIVDLVCAHDPTSLPECGNLVVFVTSTQQDADLGGLAGADKICNDLATASPLAGKRFVAWLSTTTVDARDRISEPGKAFVRPDGAVVASSIADLTDGTLTNAIRRDENNQDNLGAGNFSVFTGTGADGTLNTNSGAGTCMDWTSNILAQPLVFDGIALRTNAGWTSAFRTRCQNDLRLYCFEVPN